MVFVPVTFVLAALLSAQGAVSAPVDPTSSLLAARAPAPSSSSSGVKKPMTLPLPPKALLRTKSAKFKAAMPSKHAATAAKKTDGDAAHVEGKHHRDDRHSSSKKKSHKGKSHRERKSHKRRILDWGSDDEEDAALMNVQIDVDRRDHDHDHDHDRHHDHDHSHSDASGHDHDHDHSKRLITVYSRDHDHSHSHDSERHHDHDRTHRHGSEKDHDHDHSKRSVVDVDIGSSQFGDSSEYYSPPPTYSYDDTASLVDFDVDLNKRDDGTTYYYLDDNDLIDLDVQLKRRDEHIHSHGHNEHSSDRDEDRHGHKHNHRRKLEFAPLFNATGNEPFKYVGAKQNAVPVQKSGKKNTKRDGGDVPASDGCPELSSAVPGYLQLVTPSTESSKPSPLANLVLTAEPAPASPFMMDGSANISHATVQLVRLGPAPADDSTGLMTVKFVVKMFDAQNANMCCLCASYNQHEVSPLMLSPCANDNSTDFSQSFSYDPVTSFVAPMGGGGDSAPDATKRAVPAPGRFFAQDSFAENVALPPPASSAKAASLSRTSTGTSVTMEDEETSSSSESMTSTSSAPDATTTDEPGTAEDEEPPLVSDITTVTFTTSVTSSAPVTETGAADELIEPTKTVEATSASTTAAAPTETAPAMASNGKDIYLSFRPVVDNIKPADASPSESTTATESTATTSVTATTTDSAVPAMATAKHALDESMTATESTTTTSATATATESAVPAAMATGKHEIDGIPAAVTAKPADAEEDDDLPDCDDDDEDDEDDEDAEVESKMNDASIKATKTISKLMHSATGAATPAAKPSSMGTSSPPAMEDWPAPYRLRFVREEDTLATEDGEPEQWPEFEGDEASIEGI